VDVYAVHESISSDVETLHPPLGLVIALLPYTNPKPCSLTEDWVIERFHIQEFPRLKGQRFIGRRRCY